MKGTLTDFYREKKLLDVHGHQKYISHILLNKKTNTVSRGGLCTTKAVVQCAELLLWPAAVIPCRWAAKTQAPLDLASSWKGQSSLRSRSSVWSACVDITGAACHAATGNRLLTFAAPERRTGGRDSAGFMVAGEDNQGGLWMPFKSDFWINLLSLERKWWYFQLSHESNQVILRARVARCQCGF